MFWLSRRYSFSQKEKSPLWPIVTPFDRRVVTARIVEKQIVKYLGPTPKRHPPLKSKSFRPVLRSTGHLLNAWLLHGYRPDKGDDGQGRTRGMLSCSRETVPSRVRRRRRRDTRVRWETSARETEETARGEGGFRISARTERQRRPARTVTTPYTAGNHGNGIGHAAVHARATATREGARARAHSSRITHGGVRPTRRVCVYATTTTTNKHGGVSSGLSAAVRLLLYITRTLPLPPLPSNRLGRYTGRWQRGDPRTKFLGQNVFYLFLPRKRVWLWPNVRGSCSSLWSRNSP